LLSFVIDSRFPCSVLKVECKSEWQAADLASWDVLHVDLRVHGALGRWVQLPLQRGAQEAVVVEAELPGVVSLSVDKSES